MKRFFLSLSLALPILCFAQANFKKGYLITNSKDTVSGFINFKEQQLSPNSLTFKKELNDDSKIYNVDSVLKFSINGLEKYQRYMVNISMSQIDVSMLNVGIDTTNNRKNIFLKVLQPGKNVTLFSYTDDVKQRFYVLDKADSEPKELIKQLYYAQDNVREIRTQNKYQNQLLLLMRKYDLPVQNEQRLVGLEYDEKALGEVVAMINGNKVIRTKPAIFLFAGSGLNFTKISYNGTSEFNTGTETNKGSLLPFLNVGIDVFINPSIGKTIFRVELSFAYSENLISNVTAYNYKSRITHSFDQLNIALVPQLKYNFYNTSKLKVFGIAGFAINYAMYNNNKITWYNSLLDVTSEFNELVELEKIYYSFPLKTGVVVNKKIEISLGYVFPIEVSNYTVSNVRMSSYKVGVAYLFGKH